MLRFFRQIRKQLMEQNKVRAYIFYAIGEIALVMVGILLAVQVNAYVEGVREESRRMEVANGLTLEFEQNLTKIDTAIQIKERVLKASNSLIELQAYRGEKTLDARVDSLVSDISWIWTYDPVNGVLSSVISSGDIHLLNNDSLKVLLFSWQTLVDDASEEQTRAVNQYQEYLVPYLEERMPMSNTVFYYSGLIPKSSFTYNYQSMLSDPLFENLLVSRSLLTLDILNELEPLRSINIRILELIELELGQ